MAIGANLPGDDGAPPVETCRAAAAALDGLCGLRLVALSRWWRTAPDPPDPDSPPYCNGVARLRGPLDGVDPAALLRALLGIEARFGRSRPRPLAPRTLDLDLVALGGVLREASDPILPHPRAHLRRFVLLPLLEVAPGWRHPRDGASARALLLALPPDGAEPMPAA